MTDSQQPPSADERAPPEPSALACWIFDHRVSAVQVDYRMTGVDTANTWLILTGFNNGAGKAPKTECHDYDFNAVAELKLGYNTCVELKYGQREKIEVYRAFMKRHKRELAEYRRLQIKFGGSSNVG